jgi:hypothetical protein
MWLFTFDLWCRQRKRLVVLGTITVGVSLTDWFIFVPAGVLMVQYIIADHCIPSRLVSPIA